jgi:hypothetical protein
MAKTDVITNMASFPQAFIFAGSEVTLAPGEIYRVPVKQQEDVDFMLETKHGKGLVEMGFLSIGANKSNNRTEAKTPDMPLELQQPVQAGSSGITVGTEGKGTKMKAAGTAKV